MKGIVRVTEYLLNNSASQTFKISKAIAIISVIIAHSPLLTSNKFLQEMWNNLGAAGVPIFLVISGLYFNPEKYKTICCFLKSKIETIFIPWVMCGTFLYLFSPIWLYLKNKTQITITLFSWIRYLTGYNTLLYYLTILMVCYILMFYPVLRKQRNIFFIAMFSTALSIGLTNLGVLTELLKVIGLTNYLNFFNFIGWFSLGVVLKSYNLKNFLYFCRKCTAVVAVSYIAAILIAIKFEFETGYFGFYGILIQILAITFVFGLSNNKIMDNRILNKISELSFSIYLLHLLFFSITSNLPLIPSFLVPFVIILLSSLFIMGNQWLAQKFNFDRIYKILVGIR
jgi:peptidoglycan/LPS O-acetylase OafA/YrhL